jgi:hypothetical protein
MTAYCTHRPILMRRQLKDKRVAPKPCINTYGQDKGPDHLARNEQEARAIIQRAFQMAAGAEL